MTKAQMAEKAALEAIEAEKMRKARSARFWSTLTIFVFLTASMAANVASARHNVISWLVAGTVPFAFFMTSHLIVHTGNVRAKWAVITLMGAITLITGVVSYQHIRHLCLAAGETTLNASLLPFAIDIPIVVATLILVANTKKVTPTPAIQTVPATVEKETKVAVPAKTAAPAKRTNGAKVPSLAKDLVTA